MVNVKKMPRFIWFASGFILIFCLLLAIYCGSVLLIKTHGINIKPSLEIQPKKVEIFLQNDNRWREDYLGKSNYRIGSHGCLLSVIASAITDLGYETNPKDLNIIFTENGVYTKAGDIIWYKINDTVPNIIYDYKRIFNGSTIISDLKGGYLPIVMVKYHKTGIYHWVLIVGSTKDDFLIVDPLNQNKQVIPLQTHGKVYAYRVLQNRQ